MKKIVILLIVLSMLLVVSSCGKKADNDSQAQSQNTIGADVIVAGVTFSPASNWVDLGPSGMRNASYYMNPTEDDADSATLALYYFGPTEGGTVEHNLERWISQFTQPDESDSHTKSEMTEIIVDDMTAHVLEVFGTYLAGSMMGQPEEKSGYFLFGVVLEAPEGNLFFKLTGPEKTAKVMADELVELVKAIKKN